jgi:hypothetical protein
VLFSTDGGHYEESKWRTYGLSTFAGNCVIVDGLGQKRQSPDRDSMIPKGSIDAHWQSTPEYDFARGGYNKGYGPQRVHLATQVRRVLFVKPDLFVVADTLTPNDSSDHTYQARWQLLPAQVHQDPVSHEVTTTVPGQPNLAVVPLLTQGLEVKAVSAQTEPELLGWNVRHSFDPEAIPSTTVLHIRKGEGVQSFLTLFIPIQTGAPEPVKSVTPSGDNGAVVVLADGRSLAISASKAPMDAVEVTETLANGDAGRHVTAK